MRLQAVGFSQEAHRSCLTIVEAGPAGQIRVADLIKHRARIQAHAQSNPASSLHSLRALSFWKGCFPAAVGEVFGN